MTAAHVDMEVKNMVMSFRVSELQMLLGDFGCNRYGKKHELLSRTMDLLDSPQFKMVQEKIIELYRHRYPSRSNGSTTSRVVDVNRNSNKGNGSRSQPRRVDCKFISLPFYQQQSEVLQPLLLPFKDNSRISNDLHFQFSHHQCQDLSASKSISKFPVKYQVQLRICMYDPKNSSSFENLDYLPVNLILKLNNSQVFLPPLITATKVGVEAKRPNMPVDITKYCRISPTAENKMEVRWRADGEKFLVAIINIVTKLGSEDLMRALERKPMCPTSTAKALIQRKYSDTDVEIMTTSLKVSLLCPLGKMRMKTPIRASTCTHLQCFDASFYFMMNERKQTWLCPVCNRPAVFSRLRVDALFKEILEKCSSNDIEFDDNGQWHVSKKKTETVIIGTTPMKPIALDLSSTATKEIQKKKIDIIDLTGSSDEESDDVAITIPSVTSSSDDITISSSPISVESPHPNYSRNGVSPHSPRSRLLDVPRPDYSRHHHHNHHRRSPHHKSRSSVVKTRPPTQVSPYSRPAKSPHLVTPPLHRPPIISHSSPSSGIGGYLDAAPIPIISPFVSATPPSSSTPILDPGLGLAGYQTPPLLLANDPTFQSLGFPPPAPFDPASLYTSLPQFYDFPNLIHRSLMQHPLENYYRSLQQRLSPLREGASQAPTYLNDNLDDFTSDAIRID